MSAAAAAASSKKTFQRPTAKRQSDGETFLCRNSTQKTKEIFIDRSGTVFLGEDAASGDVFWDSHEEALFVNGELWYPYNAAGIRRFIGQSSITVRTTEEMKNKPKNVRAPVASQADNRDKSSKRAKRDNSSKEPKVDMVAREDQYAQLASEFVVFIKAHGAPVAMKFVEYVLAEAEKPADQRKQFWKVFGSHPFRHDCAPFIGRLYGGAPVLRSLLTRCVQAWFLECSKFSPLFMGVALTSSSLY